MYSSFSFLVFIGVQMWKDTNIMLLGSVWDRGSCSMNQGLYCTKSLAIHHKIHLLIYSLILDHYVKYSNLNSTSTGSTIVVSNMTETRGGIEGSLSCLAMANIWLHSMQENSIVLTTLSLLEAFHFEISHLF